MVKDRRKIGGVSNKRGNRYEDYFAVFRLMQWAPKVIDKGSVVRLMEQAGCPVDDLLLLEPRSHHYHQLKADKSITWGEAKGKLREEFREQRRRCEAAKEKFKLILVVADEARKKS